MRSGITLTFTSSSEQFRHLRVQKTRIKEEASIIPMRTSNGLRFVGVLFIAHDGLVA